MDELWTVEFASTTGFFGAGIVVFRNGVLLGGDSGYTYIGTYHRHEGAFKAKLVIEQFIEAYPHIFGAIGTRFILDIDGHIGELEGSGKGRIEGNAQLRMSLKLKKRVQR